MSRPSSVLIVFLALAATVGLAHAGSCGDEIAQLRQALRKSATNSAAGPTAPQSIGAQLSRQPTAESVAQAEAVAQSRFAAALAHAETLEAEGRHADCAQAIANARRMLLPD